MKKLCLASCIVGVCLFLTAGSGLAKDSKDPTNVIKKQQARITQAQRQAAAERLKAARAQVAADTQIAGNQVIGTAMDMPMPGDVPDYFGVANWAYSPQIRKFIDTVPGLNAEAANNLGQYIPVAIADDTTYADADYYEIALVQYKEKMHTDLPRTTLRGYVQLETPANAAVSKHIALTYPGNIPILDISGNQVYAVDKPHYLGPMIIAQKNRPVRIKFTNYLPTGQGGNLFIPVDTTVMGAGMGPVQTPDGMMEMYTQNRATIHLHGGRTPWISDGTPHQWITPAGENTSYPKGVSVNNVPDMPDPGDGSMTFYYSNQQSARLMFYHDHSYGITRLNVYAGEAGAYLIQDQVEKELVDSGLIPADQIPLVIQDKTFVDAATIMQTDPLWKWGSMPGMPMTGDLWMPHVYVPAQNPYDISGVNPYGRWHYGPWFWPPTSDISYPPVPNPLYDPINAPWQPPFNPGTPHPSMGMESFFDTPIVNGTAFPTVTLEPKAYRFRILNAANDRFFNLQLYLADPDVTTSDLRTLTEVRMVPAVAYPADPNWPQSFEDGNETWPTDGRDGGVPDWTMRGPDWIQIGTEGGFLPMPAVVKQRPVDWNADPTTFNAGNVNSHSLLLGPAERADVIVDFSAFAGQTLILYNDAPAAFPALDPRYDYYTDDPNMTDTGGHWGTKAGFGPNTRTIMQIKIAANQPAPAFNLDALKAAFTSTDTADGVFKRGQDPIIVGQTAYNFAYNTTFPSTWPNWGVSRIQDNSLTFKTIAGSIVTIPMEPKAIQDEMGEAFDEYGRMSGFLGLEMPSTLAGNQNFMLYPFGSPPVEILAPYITGTPIGTLGDGIQVWKITHNGVDTHPIHFHLYDVQLINRVGWDGAIRLPDKNELGWKDTVRVSPLEDTIVAIRATLPDVPFKVPNSIRLIDPTMPEGAPLMGGPGGFVDPSGEPVSILNHYVNFGWEYMWHCHILSHEEMDMMHSVVIAGIPDAPTDLTAGLVANGSGYAVNLSWTDNDINETGFIIQRAADSSFTDAVSIAVDMNVTTYTDSLGPTPGTYYYRVAAVNTVGDTQTYPDPAIGFPTKTSVSAASNTATAVIVNVLGAPTSVTAVAGNAQATVSFTPPAYDGGSPITLYIVTSNPGGVIATGTASPIVITGLTNGTAYTFTVAAQNAVETGPASEPSNSVTPIAPPPAAPTNLTVAAVAAVGHANVTLAWQDNADNETGFVIQRATNTGFSQGLTTFAAPANPNTGNVSFVDNTAASNTRYYYRVRAVNAVGTSAWSNRVTVLTPPSLPTAPAAPSNLRIASFNRNSITIRYNDNSNNEQGFYIERSTAGSAGPWTRIATVGPNTTSYRNSNLSRRTTYWYRVQAYNAGGSSQYSNVISGSTN